jgi:hypothetical protein
MIAIRLGRVLASCTHTNKHQFVRDGIHIPTRTRPTDQIENLVRLLVLQACLLAHVVQSIHDILQNVQRRETSHASAIERKEAVACVFKSLYIDMALQGIIFYRARHSVEVRSCSNN